jgi:transcriptional regulator with XRE-family HTH domain
MLATGQDRPVSLSVSPPITTAQIRAARGLLKWTQATLATRAGLSAVTLNMIENETVRPRETTLAAIRHALEGGGVRFLMEDGIGVGVRFAPAAATGERDD